MARPNAIWRDFDSAALWAGVTAFVWYAFGTVPLHIAVSNQLGITPEQTSSWIFILWFTGAVSSISLSVYFRQPIPITWTIPGLIYLGTLAGHFTYAELVGANLVAGVLIIVLGLLGVGARIMRWLPLPIVMGMFAGSIVNYATRLVSATVEDIVVAGSTVAAYLIARLVNSRRLPPVGIAMLVGGIVIVIADRALPAQVSWALPAVAIPRMTFSLSAIFAVSLPMLILSMGLGNVQGLGFLLAQGYRVPINSITTILGINSVINALFGGHPAIVARTGVAILASPEAGPPESRYWANVIAASLTLTIAIAAAPVASLLRILPMPFVYALAGLAIISSLQDALVKAFGQNLRFGALVGFAVAATPFSFLGITSAFWAVVAGLVASFFGENQELLEHWRNQNKR